MKCFSKMMNGRRMVRVALAGLLGLTVSLPLLASEPEPVAVPIDRAPVEAVVRPQIEVVFVLDTTGSMSGLIEGAKQKIWSIANEMINTKPVPELKIGLVAYRDRGDDYITQQHDLSSDLDAVHKTLTGFKADGGGDTPESVNQALHEAVTKMSWTEDKSVLKIIFLVGDAPPQMNYEQDIKYATTCEIAVKKDLMINTILCGSNQQAAEHWQTIARSAEGQFVAIDQRGGMQVVTAPQDETIAKLNAELSKTIIAYGNAEDQARVAGSAKVLREAEAVSGAMRPAAAATAADRAEYVEKINAELEVSDEGRAILGDDADHAAIMTGRNDLLQDIAQGRIKYDSLDKDQLPDHLKKMSEAERLAYIKEQAKKRAEIQTQLTEQLKQRENYLAAERKKLENKDGFDGKVRSILRKQAKSKGIEYAD